MSEYISKRDQVVFLVCKGNASHNDGDAKDNRGDPTPPGFIFEMSKTGYKIKNDEDKGNEQSRNKRRGYFLIHASRFYGFKNSFSPLIIPITFPLSRFPMKAEFLDLDRICDSSKLYCTPGINMVRSAFSSFLMV
jgi:hypothetical protein